MEFAAITFEDGTCAVVSSDPNQPRFLEVIATFYDTARARNYARAENKQSHRLEEEATPIKEEAAADLSERQQAVLKALRAKMDENSLAQVRAAPLAQAAQIPLGSLHSILASLKKKQLIHTNRGICKGCLTLAGRKTSRTTRWESQPRFERPVHVSPYRRPSPPVLPVVLFAIA